MHHPDNNFKNHAFIEINEAWFTKSLQIINQLKEQLNDPRKSFLVQSAVDVKTKANGIRSMFQSAFGEANNTESTIGPEYKGIYLFGESDGHNLFKPAYTGISRTMIRRFKGHTIMPGSNNASWAFLMARHKISNLSSEDFEKHHRARIQETIRSYNFTMVPIENDFDMHILEGMAACVLKTRWNSFSTH